MMRRSICVCATMILSAVAAAAAHGEAINHVTDISPGFGSGGASYLTPYGGELYFRANHDASTTDAELWSYNGVGVHRVADINPGPNGSSPSYLCEYNGWLYFGASGASGPPKLYRTNGATTELAPGSTGGPQNPEEMFVFNNTLYFRGFTVANGIELYKFNGTSQTLIDMFPGSGNSYPQHFITFNGLMYFNACGQAGQGTELWRTNGTAIANAATIYPNNGSSPEHFRVFNNELYFSAYDGATGRELWRYTGSQALPAADIVPGGQYSSSNPNNLYVYQGKLYFSATDVTHGYELWCYDAVTPPAMVAEINPTPNPGNGDDFLMDSSPADFVEYNGLLYFTANDGVHGRELWRYDGHEVSMVADLNPGPSGSDPTGLMVWNGGLYYQANDGQAGGELGTLAGAVYQLSGPVPEPGAGVVLMVLGALAAGLRPARRRST